jgi:hypothetical protein
MQNLGLHQGLLLFLLSTAQFQSEHFRYNLVKTECNLQQK